MLKIVIPESTEKIKQYITALEYLIERDITEKDRQIHQASLDVLKNELKKRIKIETKDVIIKFLYWALYHLMRDRNFVVMNFKTYTNLINAYNELIEYYILQIGYYLKDEVNIDDDIILNALKQILDSYKREYELFKEHKEDIVFYEDLLVFYNDLAGWYEDIPFDLERIIKNLTDKS